jgi:hypothetical protein
MPNRSYAVEEDRDAMRSRRLSHIYWQLKAADIQVDTRDGKAESCEHPSELPTNIT